MITYNTIKEGLSAIGKWIVIIVFLGSIGAGVYFWNKSTKLEQKNEVLTNNNLSLAGTLQGEVDSNYTLRMSMAQMRKSNDELTKALATKIDESGFEEDDITDAVVIDQGLNVVTSDTIFLKDDCSFSKVIEHNPQTKSYITMELDSLNVYDIKDSLAIRDSLYFIKGDKVPYKNIYSEKRYKDFFMRLVRLDFKKDHLKAYEIEHSNNAIKNEGVRVINIED